MRFQVPQFVDIEDKVVGPLTLRQFMIYVGTCLALVPVFLVTDLSLFLTIALPAVGMAGAFAHLKINQKSLFVVIANAFTFFTRGQVFIWRRTEQVKLLPIQGEEYSEIVARAEPMMTLRERARLLETQGQLVKEDEVDVIGGEEEANA
jgi:hypothetical protein